MTIPSSVTTIQVSAFRNCTSLTSVTLNEGVTTIGKVLDPDYIDPEYGVFSGCTSLTSITIPNTVTTIGDYTFSGCTSLTNVNIGNNMKEIGYGAFRSCSALTSIIIPNSVTTIGGAAFSSCTSLASATIGNSVKEIGYEAFYNCSALTEVSSLAKIPPTLGDYSLFPYNRNTLKVPNGSKAAYETSDWKQYFDNIVELN